VTQTTLALSFRKARVEFGATTTDMTVITGQATAVAVSGGARGGAEGHTFDGDFPIIKPGKLAPLDIAVRFLYTESSSEAFKVAKAIYDTEGAACFLRFTPSGASTGSDLVHKTANAAGSEAAGYMTEFLHPGGDVGDTDLIPGAFTVRCERIIDEAAS